MAEPSKDTEWLVRGRIEWNKKRERCPDWIPDLSGTNISRCLKEECKVTESGKPDLSAYDLTGVDLSGTNLSGADLSDTKLADANLTCANLSSCKMWKADFALDGGQSLTCKKVKLKELEWVGSVNDFIFCVEELKEYYTVGKASDSPMMFFRGEGRKHCCLRPSVMRPKSKEQYPLRKRESDLLIELTRRRPEDFADESTALGQLMIAQHHRLPTRLLDVSQNPLVSLFHACDMDKRHKKADAQLHVFVVPRSMIKPYTSHTVSVIANFTRLRRGEQNLLLTKTKEYTDKRKDCPPSSSQLPLRPGEYRSAMARLVQFVRLEHSSFEERIDPRDFFKVFVVQPQQSFERIRAQSGAFLLSAFHEQFDEPDVGKMNCGVPIYHQYTFKIPYELKQQIRKQLSTLNITEETMYPGLEKAAKAVKRQYGG